MTKSNIVPGHASLKDLAYWINERHRIYVNRVLKRRDKPWTNDPIFLDYKFTNAFRQLDVGTIALGRMVSNKEGLDLLAFNILWYRLFNWHKHAYDCGWCKTFKQLQDYIWDCNLHSRQIFTPAHMTTGVSGEPKYRTYLRACRMAFDKRKDVVKVCKTNSMEQVFDYLRGLYMVGKFVAYEIVCDFRFTKLLQDATDINTWANIGPGAARGLRRLGMPETLDSIIELRHDLVAYLEEHILDCEWPFELREVEHSLCEFDKYQRVKTGVGKPRQRYNGRNTDSN